MAQASAARRAEDETLRTKATREAMAAKKKRRYRKALVRVRFPDGVIIQANVLDVSVTGAAFECLERPRIGEPLRVGEMSGRVARILDNGFAVVFDPPQAKTSGPEAA